MNHSANNQLAEPANSKDPEPVPDVDSLLYPGCLYQHYDWQMNHAERCALTTVLSRFAPECSIEVGTYRGGSLSLIAQHSHVVFSLDIDPAIPEKFAYMDNVSFVTSPSSVSLPLLLRELSAERVPIGFVLIDGDHSEEGVRTDIQSVLQHPPLRPMAVIIHDSFNPGCRHGIRCAGWETCEHVHAVDLDFVTGGVVNQPGGPFDGQLWGGLAFALLQPARRKGALTVQASGEKTFRRCSAGGG